jgi:hypothetical protein
MGNEYEQELPRDDSHVHFSSRRVTDEELDEREAEEQRKRIEKEEKIREKHKSTRDHRLAQKKKEPDPHQRKKRRSKKGAAIVDLSLLSQDVQEIKKKLIQNDQQPPQQ